MKIGIDLDNTLACYDATFARLAAERDIEVAAGASAKRVLRDALRRQSGGEVAWTLAQGETYGPGLAYAQPYPGAIEAIRGWIRAGHEVVVISHKSLFPAIGPVHDFHALARAWIARWLGDVPVRVFFETTRWNKIRRIESERCSMFIDDLLDVLEEPTFPAVTQRVWFTDGPATGRAPDIVRVVRTWDEIARLATTPSTGNTAVSAQPGETRRRTGAFTGDAAGAFGALVEQHLGARLARWEPRPGGINNLGARLTLEDGRVVFGKIYKRSPLDPRDRLQHETRFLRLAESAGIACVPRVLAIDEDLGAALHTHVGGECWPESRSAPAALWAQCDAFIARLQQAAGLPDAADLPLAAEAAVSLQEHLAWVLDRRDIWRARTRAGEVAAPLVARVDELDAACEAHARATIGHPEFQRAIRRADMILTPSDFGLHNALVTDDGRVSFVDFEYAGWDDPAKTEADFTLQPRYGEGRPARLASLDGRYDRSSSRSAMIRELLALKWRFIQLARAQALASNAATERTPAHASLS